MKQNLLGNWKERLEKIAKNLDNMTPAWVNVGEYIKKRTVKECFEKEQSPNGVKWAKWSESYRKYIENRARNKRGKKKKLGTKILQDSGELRRSINFKAFRNYVIVGTNKKYAALHQFGAKKGQFGTPTVSFMDRNGRYYSRKVPIPWGDVPARPFLGITQKDKERTIEILVRHIKRG